MRKHPLRRIVLSTVGTVSGVLLLLALKPHTPPVGSVQASDPAPSVTASAAAPSASASPSRSASTSASPSPSKTKSSSAPASKTPSATRSTSKPPSQPDPVDSTRTVTGNTVQTKYGPVQVKITVSGGRITAASAVQSPSSTPRSKELSSTAIPKLNQETLAAQSANIDTVSGATYTSQGYIGSLQSALDKAGV